jgi:NAD(P)-dependent dehydrogenase (short-subunit alcohol dehydrogenase family)
MAGRLQGKRVVVTDASEFMGPDIVALFREEGGEVIADVRDLQQPGASEALIIEAGHVDVLMVNLAGASSGKAVGEVQDAELDMLLDRQVRPLHRLTRAVLPQMLARRKGKIVVVGSATGCGDSRAVPPIPPPARRSTAMCDRLGPSAAFGVNVIATGQTFVENPTYFPPSCQATEDFKQRMQGVPAGRLSTGREAAMFLLALAGPESDWIFGQVFPYAGGWVT